MNIEKLEQRIGGIQVQSYSFVDKYSEMLAVAKDMLALLKEQAEELRLERNFASDRDDEMREVYAENTRLRVALDRLVKLKYTKDSMGKTSAYFKEQPLAWEQARKALENPDG